MGLMFSKSVHDETAYRAVQTIALEMLALATGESWEQIEPLRATIFSKPTPVVGGDAAIIDDEGRIESSAPTTACGPCRAVLSKWVRHLPKEQFERRWKKLEFTASRLRSWAYLTRGAAG
jgi:hypothetical protein